MKARRRLHMLYCLDSKSSLFPVSVRMKYRDIPCIFRAIPSFDLFLETLLFCLLSRGFNGFIIIQIAVTHHYHATVMRLIGLF